MQLGSQGKQYGSAIGGFAGRWYSELLKHIPFSIAIEIERREVMKREIRVPRLNYVLLARGWKGRGWEARDWHRG
jgi:hypothetical protein